MSKLTAHGPLCRPTSFLVDPNFRVLSWPGFLYHLQPDILLQKYIKNRRTGGPDYQAFGELCSLKAR